MPNIPKKAVIKGQKHALTYLTEEEMELLRKLTGKKHPRGPGGVPSFADGDGDSDGGDPDGGDSGYGGGEADAGGGPGSDPSSFGGDPGSGWGGDPGGDFGISAGDVGDVSSDLGISFGGESLGDFGISQGDVGDVQGDLGISFGGESLGDFGISMGDVGDVESGLGVGISNFDFSMPDYSLSAYSSSPPTIEGLWSKIKTTFNTPPMQGLRFMLSGRIPSSYTPKEAVNWSPEKLARFQQDLAETGNPGSLAGKVGQYGIGALAGLGLAAGPLGSVATAMTQGAAMAARGWGDLSTTHSDPDASIGGVEGYAGDQNALDQGSLAALMQDQASKSSESGTGRARQQALTGEYRNQAAYWRPKG